MVKCFSSLRASAPMLWQQSKKGRVKKETIFFDEYQSSPKTLQTPPLPPHQATHCFVFKKYQNCNTKSNMLTVLDPKILIFHYF